MITLNRISVYGANRNVLEFSGLATDEKPIKKFENFQITNGSTLLELDTSAVFAYDEENERWLEL